MTENPFEEWARGQARFAASGSGIRDGQDRAGMSCGMTLLGWFIIIALVLGVIQEIGFLL